MFTERQENKIEIIPPFYIIQCRVSDIVEKDGEEISRKYTRYVRYPGDNLENDCYEVRAVAEALWTTEIINNYKNSIT